MNVYPQIDYVQIKINTKAYTDYVQVKIPKDLSACLQEYWACDACHIFVETNNHTSEACHTFVETILSLK